MLRRLIVSVVLLFCLAPAWAQPPYVAPTPPAWDGQSRYTVLVVGIDRRPNSGASLAFRGDVLMLASYDPLAKTLGILGIPRDMHMGLPDTGELVRVNTLMVLGENRAVGYGPYYTMETLQYNFGMPIDAYIVFDFQGFISIIDAIGGVPINIPYTLSDPLYPDMNYGYDPLYIQAGYQVLDGRTALKFARTRHADSDYLRVERQQMVIRAAMEQVRRPEVQQQLIANFPLLLGAVQGHLYTNIPQELLLPMALNVLGVERVQTGSLNEAYSFEYSTLNGTVRVPYTNKLAELLTATFGAEYGR